MVDAGMWYSGCAALVFWRPATGTSPLSAARAFPDSLAADPYSAETLFISCFFRIQYLSEFSVGRGLQLFRCLTAGAQESAGKELHSLQVLQLSDYLVQAAIEVIDSFVDAQLVCR
jgi:hypothetical protein